MELGPWAPCIDRLATTPEEATALLADVVKILEARASHLAGRGQRVWEPSPDMPALIIVIDEYAELVDDAPAAVRHADSIARRGRAVAVNLVAATQRPTQKAMGQGAVRSQMDVRISFPVRERKDVDLILGQGMPAAGWHAHTLNAPGKFLVAAAEHDVPKRARAYLATDQAVASTTEMYADFPPRLDLISQQAAAQDPHSGDVYPKRDPYSERNRPAWHFPAPVADDEDPDDAPEVVLWAALAIAPPEGTTVPDLVAETGMSRPWVYLRLRELADRRQVIQVSRGRWRAAPSDTAFE